MMKSEPFDKIHRGKKDYSKKISLCVTMEQNEPHSACAESANKGVHICSYACQVRVAVCNSSLCCVCDIFQALINSLVQFIDTTVCNC